MKRSLVVVVLALIALILAVLLRTKDEVEELKSHLLTLGGKVSERIEIKNGVRGRFLLQHLLQLSSSTSFSSSFLLLIINRGIFASKPIKKKHLLFKIPLSECISSSGDGDDDDDGALRYSEKTLLKLLKEWNDRSLYTNTLPKDYSFNPVVWTKEEISLLQGFDTFTPFSLLHTLLGTGDVERTFKKRMKDVEGGFALAKMKINNLTFEKYVFAETMVKSRSFNVLVNDKRERSLMVPLVDLINHEEMKQRSIWFVKDGFFFLKAAKDFKKGEEVVNSYTFKKKTIGIWLSTYGFIPDRMDFPVLIDLEIEDEERRQILPKLTPVSVDRVFAQTMVSACVKAATEKEWKEIRKIRKSELKNWKKW